MFTFILVIMPRYFHLLLSCIELSPIQEALIIKQARVLDLLILERNLRKQLVSYTLEK